MNILKTSRTKTSQKDMVSVQEAYNIWSMLSDRYGYINHLQTQENFLHDLDFKKILNNHISRYKRQIETIEQEAEKFSIKGPERPYAHDINVKGNTEVTRDRDLAWILLKMLENDLLALIKVVRDALSNDHISAVFFGLLKESIQALFDYQDYMKFKGWIDIPPLYPYVPDGVPERISSNEIYYLWDHLTFRYSNTHITRIFSSYVYDKDLKIIFDQGIKVLEKQADRIEDMLMRYGVTIPKPFSSVIPTPEATEVLSDEFMFFDIFNRMKDASALHAQAFIGSLVNDRVRKLFYDLLIEENSMINNLLKYGKIKGWVPLIPNYKMG